MSKKKEQVKSLKKSFRSVIKAFEKEKNKKKRNEAFEFLTGRIAEFKQYASEAAAAKNQKSNILVAEYAQASSGIVPSPALVDEIRSEHQHKQD
jgi:hypothetical protein